MKVKCGRARCDHPDNDQDRVCIDGQMVGRCPKGGPQRMSDLIDQEEDGRGEEEDVS